MQHTTCSLKETAYPAAEYDADWSQTTTDQTMNTENIQ